MILSALVAVLADDQPQVDPDTVTPGVVGFIITFLVAVGAVLLILDMVRRIRRVNYRAQAREKILAERNADSDATPREPDA